MSLSIAEDEAEEGIKFKVVETGRKTVKSHLQKSTLQLHLAVLSQTDWHAVLSGERVATAITQESNMKLNASSAHLMLGDLVETARNLYSFY